MQEPVKRKKVTDKKYFFKKLHAFVQFDPHLAVWVKGLFLWGVKAWTGI